MEKRKMLGISSFLLLVLLIILFVENKHDFILGDFILSKMGISVWSNGESGLHYTGVVAAVLLIIAISGIVSFKKDVHRNFGRFVLIFFLVGAVIYQPTYDSVYGFVKSNLNGLEPIEYIKDDSQINFKSVNNDILFTGKIGLKNYSRDIKEFYIKIPLEQRRSVIKDLNKITICNNYNKPAKFIIGPKSEFYLDINFSVKQNEELNNCSGSMLPVIILFNGTEEKKFLLNKY
jgi:hypothetical protein